MQKIQPVIPYSNAMKLSKPYWITISAIWFIGFLFLLMYGSYDSFLLINKNHTPFFDTFFSLFTHVGDGLFALSIAIIFFIFKYRRFAFNIVFSFLLSGLLIQIVKNITSEPRPSTYFTSAGNNSIHLLEVTNWGNNTYPSGHTTSLFALLSMIILFFPKSKWNFLWILIAFLGGYSRMYVASHFLDDVLAGIAFGIITSMICYIISNKLFDKKINFFAR